MPTVTWEELKQAKLTIEATGGSVKLSRYMVVCWGQVFRTMNDMSKDPRCKVTFRTLSERVHKGMTLEAAAEKRMNAETSHPITCWGEFFPSVSKLAADPRCQIGYQSLLAKIQAGVAPEDAVKNDSMRREVKSIDEVLAKAQRLRKPKNVGPTFEEK